MKASHLKQEVTELTIHKFRLIPNFHDNTLFLYN